MDRSGQCLTSAELASYVDRHMSQAERNNANEHLANCPRCLADMAGIARTIVEIVDRLPPAAVKEAFEVADTYQQRKAAHLKRCRQICERARRLQVDPNMTGEYLAHESGFVNSAVLEFIESLINKLEA